MRRLGDDWGATNVVLDTPDFELTRYHIQRLKTLGLCGFLLFEQASESAVALFHIDFQAR